MALSKKFIWVEINRDHAPELPKKFNVNAYPSLITLGAKQEKVYRFQAYMKPPEFTAELNEALRRYALYKKGEEWDKPNPRPPTLCDEGILELMKAPSEAIPSGIAVINRDLWVKQGETLYKLDLDTGAVRQTFPVEPSIRAICTDGNVLYGVEYGWTAGKPIHVINPATGKTIRTIITKANESNKAYAAHGIAYRHQKLYVLASLGDGLSEVDPKTGEVTKTIKPTERRLTSLTCDGQHFIAGSRTALHVLDAQTGATVRSIAVNYPIRSVGFHNGVIYVMEQPIFGYDKVHKQVRVWPPQTMIYKLRLPTSPTGQ